VRISIHLELGGLYDRVEEAVERVTADEPGRQHLHRAAGLGALPFKHRYADREPDRHRPPGQRVGDQQPGREQYAELAPRSAEQLQDGAGNSPDQQRLGDVRGRSHACREPREVFEPHVERICRRGRPAHRGTVPPLLSH
jgi:hypothetical protein